MSSISSNLYSKNLLGSPPPPRWIVGNIQMEVIMGSFAYGIDSDTSDIDLCAFCIPPKESIFPHLDGEIIDFSTQKKRFRNFQRHHIDDPESRKKYDLVVYSIQRFFRLCMENNPNMVDVLYVPRRCVTYSNQIGELVRENRKLFLHRGAWRKFKGYAYAQLSRLHNGSVLFDSQDDFLNSEDGKIIAIRNIYDFEELHNISRSTTYLQVSNHKSGNSLCPSLSNLDEKDVNKYYDLYSALLDISKRGESVKIYGYDLKFAYHVVRLLNEAEQLIEHGDLDLEESRNQLKSIRNGEWKLSEVQDYFSRKEKILEQLAVDSPLPKKPPEDRLRNLMMNCIESHYGAISESLSSQGEERKLKEALAKIANIANNSI